MLAHHSSAEHSLVDSEMSIGGQSMSAYLNGTGDMFSTHPYPANFRRAPLWLVPVYHEIDAALHYPSDVSFCDEQADDFNDE